MQKYLIRFVALFLVPCLLAEPVRAIGISIAAGPRATPNIQVRLNQEAVVPGLTVAFTTLKDPAVRYRRLIGERILRERRRLLDVWISPSSLSQPNFRDLNPEEIVNYVFQSGKSLTDLGFGESLEWGSYWAQRGLDYRGVDYAAERVRKGRQWIAQQTTAVQEHMHLMENDYFTGLADSIAPADIVTLNSPEPSYAFCEKLRSGQIAEMIFDALKEGAWAFIFTENNASWANNNNNLREAFRTTLEKKFGKENIYEFSKIPGNYYTLPLYIGTMDFASRTFFAVHKVRRDKTNSVAGSILPVLDESQGRLEKDRFDDVQRRFRGSGASSLSIKNNFPSPGFTRNPPPVEPDTSAKTKMKVAGYLELAAAVDGPSHITQKRKDKIGRIYDHFRKRYPPITAAQLTLATAFYYQGKLKTRSRVDRIEGVVRKLKMNENRIGLAALAVMATGDPEAIKSPAEYMSRKEIEIRWFKGSMDAGELQPFLLWAVSFPNAKPGIVAARYQELTEEQQYKPEVAVLLIVAESRFKKIEKGLDIGIVQNLPKHPLATLLPITLITTAEMYSWVMRYLHVKKYRAGGPEQKDARDHYQTLVGLGLDSETAGLLGIALGSDDLGFARGEVERGFKEFLERVQDENDRPRKPRRSPATAPSSLYRAA